MSLDSSKEMQVPMDFIQHVQTHTSILVCQVQIMVKKVNFKSLTTQFHLKQQFCLVVIFQAPSFQTVTQ